ncbi:MAG: glycosyltransferase family 2 protein [Desulfobulbaceae bacterium]|jgi:GT2 family glycosyltransferase|nr:glycosyltransferase family 2 protein [Desulfobulbaceae bacterium]MDY0350839.1 glycosyltransferase family 2 protein [Desulfobulbaceae bacterium]
MASTAVIIVTHNSAAVLEPCLSSLAGQSTPPDAVWVVDSGSAETSYLQAAEKKFGVGVLQFPANIGFAAANNAGFSRLGGVDHVLFLNPDTVPHHQCIQRAAESMAGNPAVGILTGRLLGYDVGGRQATGRLDSTGVFRKWYGRWFDRGQGDVDRGQYSIPEEVPAACGALMFCRIKALEDVLLAGRAVFDPAFFMYKEDIELCLRVRKAGWTIWYEPVVAALHGRGWQRRRSRMSRAARTMSARNEVLLYQRHPSPYILWALAKYAAAGLLRM